MACSATTTFTASCLCGNFHRTISLPTTAIPLKSAICQCYSCRHATGQLFATFAVVPGPVPDASWFTSLTRYPSSESLDRYFCPSCGASILNIDRNAGPGRIEWEFATGVLDFTSLKDGDGDRGSLDGKLHRALMWIDDCKDGGAAIWINRGRSEGLAGRYLQGRSGDQISQDQISALESQAIDLHTELKSNDRRDDDTLNGQCHCGAVCLQIHCPETHAAQKDCSAEFCACRSCRKTTGFEISAWTHITRNKVRAADGTPYQRHLLGILGHYQSSKGTHRYFCATCGAKVFYDRDGLGRIDVALGLFDSPTGSRAQDWFHWNPDDEDIAFLSEASDQKFASDIADGVGLLTRTDGRPRVET